MAALQLWTQVVDIALAEGSTHSVAEKTGALTSLARVFASSVHQ